MDVNQRVTILASLGNHLQNLSGESKAELYAKMQNYNNWFTPKQSAIALEGICRYLDYQQLTNWIEPYSIDNNSIPKNIGIIMAGNIPGVGFHDLLCTLVAGHRARVKLGSSDNILIPWLVEQLKDLSPELAANISFEERLSGMDAYIATGSDNSARYFDYYFGKYPHIIRKNRTSVAILNGKESEADLELLAKDIFTYYGLGCRNVSKVFFSDISQIQDFMKAMEKVNEALEHHKYFNNYEYNKSKYLINSIPHYDNGHLLLVESKDLVSPISVIYYEIYESLTDLQESLAGLEGKIQCLVSKDGWFNESIALGSAQAPEVNDYADKVDTLKFLLELN
ncbi:MAG: acyl-CoA reductase [Cytophagales bacterium]|uniref:acyl-CoA reductase n=1 Tax=Cyclobacterium marinum TaxID=104 RepID=UPI0011F06DB2|nr:acyl-CoA reductase [Cyclobacterium marinum]MBI0398706.1 acyl-CoA reductase [Cyclobacterium marinum]MBR9775993.1 acyl-CoA reductase [Cytophagales bacterium]|tara:strand:- start:19473 stop:20489 length:1017 start_codon:yes stop_codon:yes gene_type:complete